MKHYHFRLLREWKWVEGYETQVIGTLKIFVLITLVMSTLLKKLTSIKDMDLFNKKGSV